MNDLPGNLNILLHMKCEIPRTTCFMNITTNKSVFVIFKLHEKDLVVNLFVLHLEIIPTTEENTVENNQTKNAQKT